MYSFQEFHPFLFSQFSEMQTKHFASFSECVDEFFSKLELQKADVKAINAEKEAMKKLNNIMKDHQVLLWCSFQLSKLFRF